ncbi:MAG: hypothetical protein ABID54_00120 [Pseudomonadota bacterium]
MAKTLSTAVQIQQAAQEKRPVNLVILELDTGTLRYASSKTNVTFPVAGNTYVAKALTYGDISTSAEGQIGRMTVQLDNTAKDMFTYAAITPFKGRKLTIWKIYRGTSGVTDYEEVFAGIMEEPNFDYNWISIPTTAGIALEKKYPERAYGRSCALPFGGTKCNIDGNATLTGAPLYVTGASDRGGVTVLYDNALDQAADFWNYGRLTCLVSGSSEERIVVDFFSGGTVEFDIAFSTNISGGTQYSLKAGCPKTWVACSGVSAWGPTADNRNNYGGFLHVRVKQDY